MEVEFEWVIMWEADYEKGIWFRKHEGGEKSLCSCIKEADYNPIEFEYHRILQEYGERGRHPLPDSYRFIFDGLRPVQTQTDYALEITLGGLKAAFCRFWVKINYICCG